MRAPTASLRTARLRLDPRVDADAAWLVVLYSARGQGVVDVDEALSRVRRSRTDLERHRLAAWSVRRTHDGEPVGYVALVVGRSSVEEPELAYEVLPQHQRQGYATEAGAAAIEAAWRSGRTRLWLTTRPTNAASLRVARRLGFTLDRTTVDEHGAVVWLRRDAATTSATDHGSATIAAYRTSPADEGR